MMSRTRPLSKRLKRIVEFPRRPRLSADLRVTFRIKAPDAQKVEFDRGKWYLATKDAEWFWTATTDPQAPGFHYY